MLDRLMHGGRVVTPAGVGDWDVGIEGEQIVALACPGLLPAAATQVIDARGTMVVPGGIETHAHAVANIQPGARTLLPGVPNAGPLEHSLGAIWGGTTMVIDVAPVPHEGDLAQGIHDDLAPWRGQAYTDYSTHCISSNRTPPDAIARYHELIAAGFPSVKIFTTDIRPPEGRHTRLTPIAKIDTGRLEDRMRQMARHGGVLAVHGEDDARVMDNDLLAQQRGQWDWYNVHLVHSTLVEELAFQQVVRLAARNGRRHLRRARHGQGGYGRHRGGPRPGVAGLRRGADAGPFLHLRPRPRGRRDEVPRRGQRRRSRHDRPGDRENAAPGRPARPGLSPLGGLAGRGLADDGHPAGESHGGQRPATGVAHRWAAHAPEE